MIEILIMYIRKNLNKVRLQCGLFLKTAAAFGWWQQFKPRKTLSPFKLAISVYIMKDNLHNLTKYESQKTSEISISQLFNERWKTQKYIPSKYSKIPIFNIFHEYGKLRVPVRVTFQNPNFDLFMNWENLGSIA